MKRISILIVLVLITTVCASAQLRFGVKGGITTSSLHFDNKILSSERRTGWTAGGQLELRLPVIGLGVDASLMFTHRTDALRHEQTTYHRNYIEIPVHLKYTLSLVGLNKFVAPFALTGTNFVPLCSESKDISWENRASNLSWDAGFGVELFSHLQVSASYSLGITRAFSYVGLEHGGASITGRDRCWTLTACYLF